MYSFLTRLSTWFSTTVNYWIVFVVFASLISFRLDKQLDLQPQHDFFKMQLVTSEIHSQFDNFKREMSDHVFEKYNVSVDLRFLKNWNLKIVQWMLIRECYTPEDNGLIFSTTLHSKIINVWKGGSLEAKDSQILMKPFPKETDCKIKDKILVITTPFIGFFSHHIYDL
ncbi:MAG: hypothetical protein MHMPM18_000736 [Marteilia pararefringens]